MLTYHDYSTKVGAEHKLACLRSMGILAYMLTMHANWYQVREIH